LPADGAERGCKDDDFITHPRREYQERYERSPRHVVSHCMRDGGCGEETFFPDRKGKSRFAHDRQKNEVLREEQAGKEERTDV